MGPVLEANINMSDTLYFPKLNGSNYDSITNGHLLFVMGALILQRAQKCEVRQ